MPRPKSVAIITRTKDRPLLLRRAAESIARQTYKNYNWIVVNDGGGEAEVRAVLRDCAVEPTRIRLISNSQSVGMEAASNIGIRRSESEYLLIHDDDDSLHPSFLMETVRFLEGSEGKRYGGVATKTEYVSEYINNDEITTIARTPYLDWVHTVELAEMLARNVITTISFLFRRSIFNKIGGYKEDLPVLGDWYFNIEFLLHADIKLLPQTLAYYHHRDQEQHLGSDIYLNSVVAGYERHEEFASICRNRLIRENLHKGGMSSAVVMAYFASSLGTSSGHGAKPHGLAKNIALARKTSQDEFDRIWLLSLLLKNETGRSKFSLRKFPTVEFNASLTELSNLAKKNRVPILPPNGFNEDAYKRWNSDVAKALEIGEFISGYEHYILYGRQEGRERPTSL
ncbi:Glycosyl transferase family 2 [Erythrobacter litoralis]|uniref:glycosyltransferase n=1 Tax=Erythrobacter litoralis TaxID=39960 RepID=UPI000863C3FD|nr:glycosyltransferase [Erythrobacter litoralis]AOL22029.1 Glycosyl transferase family 2 [Erythrobacter litoralis]